MEPRLHPSLPRAQCRPVILLWTLRGAQEARKAVNCLRATRPSTRPLQSRIQRTRMKRVAVLGGGPAGAFAAERLANAGVNTVVIDEKLAWEKPCGGGLTYKAWSQYPFLIE